MPNDPPEKLSGTIDLRLEPPDDFGLVGAGAVGTVGAVGVVVVVGVVGVVDCQRVDAELLPRGLWLRERSNAVRVSGYCSCEMFGPGCFG